MADHSGEAKESRHESLLGVSWHRRMFVKQFDKPPMMIYLCLYHQINIVCNFWSLETVYFTNRKSHPYVLMVSFPYNQLYPTRFSRLALWIFVASHGECWGFSADRPQPLDIEPLGWDAKACFMGGFWAST